MIPIGDYNPRRFSRKLSEIEQDIRAYHGTGSIQPDSFECYECFLIRNGRIAPTAETMKPTLSPVFCDHANECPQSCFCKEDCYCQRPRELGGSGMCLRKSVTPKKATEQPEQKNTDAPKDRFELIEME
jgi:hypothetical protein